MLKVIEYSIEAYAFILLTWSTVKYKSWIPVVSWLIYGFAIILLAAISANTDPTSATYSDAIKSGIDRIRPLLTVVAIIWAIYLQIFALKGPAISKLRGHDQKSKDITNVSIDTSHASHDGMSYNE